MKKVDERNWVKIKTKKEKNDKIWHFLSRKKFVKLL